MKFTMVAYFFALLSLLFAGAVAQDDSGVSTTDDSAPTSDDFPSSTSDDNFPVSTDLPDPTDTLLPSSALSSVVPISTPTSLVTSRIPSLSSSSRRVDTPATTVPRPSSTGAASPTGIPLSNRGGLAAGVVAGVMAVAIL